MTSEAQKRASKKYKKQNIKGYMMQLNKNYDEPLIEWMESQGSKSAYLKMLVQKDMEAQ